MARLGKKDVLRIAKQKKVKFVRLWFTDILGFLKSFAITVRELEGALEEGRGFDGSSIVGFVRIDESDMVAMPDPACNPYLAFTVMVAAGLEGIMKKYPLRDAIERNVYEMTQEERKKNKIDSLPGNLYEAIQVTEESQLVRQALGEDLFYKFIGNKKIEWNRYQAQVTDYELQQYFSIL